MQGIEEIKEVLDRINRGQELPQDRQILQQWYARADDRETQIPGSGSKAALKAEIWRNISEQLPAEGPSARRYYLVAAAMLFIGLVGLWASGILGTGKTPALELQAGLHIVGGGQEQESVQGSIDSFLDTLSYVDVQAQVETGSVARVFTDKGQFAKIKLPDGTKVSLNADTKITLSPDFETSPTRTLELEGEAYFEVTSQPGRSFVVKTKSQEIHVLGTKFNVKAYPDQTQVITSLVEGKIKLVDQENTKILNPNQQAINSLETGYIEVQEKDASKVQGWRALNFQFDREPVDQVLQQLGRWYNLEVVFETPVPDQLISGRIGRGASLEDLQLILGNLTQAEYRLENQVLFVHFKLTQQP